MRLASRYRSQGSALELRPVLTRDEPGLFGSWTERSEAQLLWLSMVYALMDCSNLQELRIAGYIELETIDTGGRPARVWRLIRFCIYIAREARKARKGSGPGELSSLYRFSLREGECSDEYHHQVQAVPSNTRVQGIRHRNLGAFHLPSMKPLASRWKRREVLEGSLPLNSIVKQNTHCVTFLWLEPVMAAKRHQSNAGHL